MNHYKDAIDLAQELQTKYFGSEAQDLSARDLKREVEKRDKGIGLETEELPLSRKEEWRQHREACQALKEAKKPKVPSSWVVVDPPSLRTVDRFFKIMAREERNESAF